MSGKLSQIAIDGIIREETRKVNGRLGFSNHLSPICRKKGLNPEDFGEVYEGLWRNVIQICHSHLKNTISVKKRYEEEIAKSPQQCKDEKGESHRQAEWRERIEKHPLGYRKRAEDSNRSPF